MLASPELAALRSSRGLIRIPPELDVPVTPRVQRLIDTSPFRRLSGISQLGLVSLVYPAANHTRFEHSLGVYRMALLFLDRLADRWTDCHATNSLPTGFSARRRWRTPCARIGNWSHNRLFHY